MNNSIEEIDLVRNLSGLQRESKQLQRAFHKWFKLEDSNSNIVKELLEKNQTM